MGASSPERWQQVQELLDAALDIAPDARAVFVEHACAGDAALRDEVTRLLRACDEAAGFLEQPAAAFAAPLLERESPDAARDATAADGLRVGPYRIRCEAGRGGMGIVYLAERADDQFRRRVALKVVRHGMDADGQLVRRFLEERQILASLDHPNIAQLFDGGVAADGRPWFAMEYVEGTAIDRYCDERRLTIDDRLELFCHVCDAVAFAHRHLVVHRDIKPSNILVSRDGQVKLLDFGIAKLLAPDGGHPGGDRDATPVTRTGVRLMTPEFASPEQVRGDPVSPASDVYSLGVLLYQLLSGHGPYRGESRHAREIERAVLEGEPEPPSFAVVRDGADWRAAGERQISAQAVSEARSTVPRQLRRRLRGDLDAVVLVAMRKEPERRYATAAQLAEDVRRHLRGLPVGARRDARMTRAWRRVRRHWAPTVSLCLAAAALGGGAMLVDRRAGGTVPVTGAHRSADRGSSGATDIARLQPELLATNLAVSELLRIPGTAVEYIASSPDDRLIALTAHPDGGSARLLVVNRRTRAVTVVDQHPGDYADIAWSPRGDRIAFWRADDRGVRRIWSLPVDPVTGRTTGPAQRVSTTSGRAPTFSPDGRTLAFAREAAGPTGPSGAIVLVPANGGEERILHVVDGIVSPMRWTADGWIYYAVRDAIATNGFQTRIERRRPEHSAPEVVAEASGSAWPLVSPDGRVVVHFAPRSEQPENADRRTEDRWRVLRSPDGQEIARFRPPMFDGEGWRAAGQTMLGAHVVTPRRLQLVALDGGSSRQMLPPSDDGWIRPCWSPDGTLFAVVADGLTHVLEIFRADGALVRRVPLPERVSDMPLAWSPNGRYVAYRGETRRTLVTVEARTGRVSTADAAPRTTNFVWAGAATLRYVRSMSLKGDTASVIAVRDVGADGTGDRLVREYRINGGAAMLTPDHVLLHDFVSGDVQIAPLDGGPSRPFWLGNRMLPPAISLDGRFIAVPVAVGEPGEQRRDSLYLLPMRGGAARGLELPVDVGGAWPTVVWHPDNRHVLLTGKRPNGARAELFLVPLDGGEARVLATFRWPYERGEFALSPDGAHVLYNPSGAQATHLMEIDLGRFVGTGPRRR